MRLILNVIWLIFGGLWLALGYFLAGLICFVLIITIPFGFAAFKIGVYALWPFGNTELHALPRFETLHTFGQRRGPDVNVLPFLLREEAEALLGVVPLHLAGWHCRHPSSR